MRKHRSHFCVIHSRFKQLPPSLTTWIFLKWQQFSTINKNYNRASFFPCFLHVSTGHGKTGKGADPWRDLSSTRSLSHVGEDCRTSESIVSTTGGNEKRIDISRRKSNPIMLKMSEGIFLLVPKLPFGLTDFEATPWKPKLLHFSRTTVPQRQH